MVTEQPVPTKQISRCLDWCHHNLGDAIPCRNSKGTALKRSSAKTNEDIVLGSQVRYQRKSHVSPCSIPPPLQFPATCGCKPRAASAGHCLWGFPPLGSSSTLKQLSFKGPTAQLDSSLLAITFSNASLALGIPVDLKRTCTSLLPAAKPTFIISKGVCRFLCHHHPWGRWERTGEKAFGEWYLCSNHCGSWFIGVASFRLLRPRGR